MLLRDLVVILAAAVAVVLARDAMRALPIVESPLGRDVVEEAVDLHRAARRAGLTVRSGVDCLIAACAIRHGLTVLHCDRDFDALARVSSLDSMRVSRRECVQRSFSRPESATARRR